MGFLLGSQPALFRKLGLTARDTEAFLGKVILVMTEGPTGPELCGLLF